MANDQSGAIMAGLAIGAVVFIIVMVLKKTIKPVAATQKQAEYFYPIFPPLNTSKFNAKTPGIVPTTSFVTTTTVGDWVNQSKNLCSAYNTIQAPSDEMSCPDSSFTFVDNLGRFVPGVNHPGCIQLTRQGVNCYSHADGTYSPWWQKVLLKSPQ